jgi:hypothetical protein
MDSLLNTVLSSWPAVCVTASSDKSLNVGTLELSPNTPCVEVFIGNKVRRAERFLRPGVAHAVRPRRRTVRELSILVSIDR